MKKALIVTTVSGFVPQFEMNNVRILQEMGYEVHYAANYHMPVYGDNERLKGTGIVEHQVDFVRSPLRVVANWKAYRQLIEIMQKDSYQLVHCHTPMGGVLGRLAAKTSGIKNVLYTAHGFHFYKGAPWKNWLFFYPVERLLAHITDILITINEEDYRRAKHFHLRNVEGRMGRVEKINGVGIDIESYRKFTEVNISKGTDAERGPNLFKNLGMPEESAREKKRRELAIKGEEYVFVSVGELTKRKYHKIILKALALMKEECRQKHIRYIICGEGTERKNLENMIQKKGLDDIVTLLGYRKDVKEILAASDCFLFPSRQEGLPVALMEAMAMGLPCICADVRGNRDLVSPDDLVKNQKAAEYCKKMNRNVEKRFHQKTLTEKYSIKAVNIKMTEIYKKCEIYRVV